MKNKVRVSVIMATYNTEKKKLMDAIESILNQTYKEFEFIIVCDGLVKDYEIVKRYSDNRIKVIFNDSNIGLARSLNKALAISTGKYIVRMDSDDISLKNRIELQVDYMEKNPDIVVSDMRALCFGSYNGLKYNLFSKPDEIQVQLLYKNCLIHPAAIIRSEVLKKYNIRYNETFEVAQDYELWNRLVKYGKITQLKKIGLKYRVHSKQISIDRRELQNKNKIRVLKSNLEELDGLGFLELFLVLSGEVKISNENKERLLYSINKFIKCYGYIYNKKILKKILYNRYFELAWIDMKFNAITVRIFFKSLPYIVKKIQMKILFLWYVLKYKILNF